MKTILESIQEKDYTSAQEQLHEKLQDIAVEKIHEMRKMIAAQMTEQSLSNPTTLRSVEYAKRGLTEEDPKDDDSPFKGGDTEKVSNPKAMAKNQAKKLAIKAMSKMKEKGQ